MSPVHRSPPIRRASAEDVGPSSSASVTTRKGKQQHHQTQSHQVSTETAPETPVDPLIERPQTSMSTAERNRVLEETITAQSAELQMLKEDFAFQLNTMRAEIAALNTRENVSATRAPQVVVRESFDDRRAHDAPPTGHRGVGTHPVRPIAHHGMPHDPEIVDGNAPRSARRNPVTPAVPPEAVRAQSLRPEVPRAPIHRGTNVGYSGYIPAELRSPFVPLEVESSHRSGVVPDRLEPLRQEPLRQDSSRREPTLTLKPQDIGYWDPAAEEDGDETNSTSRALRIPVELFVRRLYRLAGRYGEQQVLDHLDSALVNVSSWLMTFSREEDLLTGTLDGWCQLLIRDFGEPEVVSRRKMREYDYSKALNAREFWTNKLSKLRISGVDREHDQYHEIWNCLPPRWQETIPMSGFLADLKSDIHQRETASGWPKPRNTTRNDTSSQRDSTNRSSTSGSSHKTGTKRGGSVNYGGSDRKSMRSNSSEKIPSCQICEGLGKPNESHWHADCPNKLKAKEHFAKLNSVIQECLDQSESEPSLNVPDDASADSDSSSDTAPTRRNSKKPNPIPPPTQVNRISSRLPGEVERLSSHHVPFLQPVPLVFDAPLITDTVFGSGDVFRTAGPVHVFLRGSQKGKDVRVCIDSGCGPTIANQSFAKDVFPQSCVQTRSNDSLKVKSGFAGESSEILTEFLSVTAYLPTTKGDLLSIRLEIHLTDSSVDSGILIGSSALRSNGLRINFRKGTMSTSEILKSSKISVPLHYDETPEFINATNICSLEDRTIPPGHEALLTVDLSDLPKDRDFWFSGRQLVIPGKEVFVKIPDSLVNSNVSKILVANFGTGPYQIPNKWVVGTVTEIPSKNFEVAPSSLRINRMGSEDFRHLRRM